MKSWLALLLAPSLALGTQSLLLSMVTPACQHQDRLAIHLVAAAALLVALVLTLLAFGEWKSYARETAESPDHDSDRPASTRRFIAIVATGVGTISTLVIVAMWIGVFVLWPCGQH
jgi:hypothetical protein